MTGPPGERPSPGPSWAARWKEAAVRYRDGFRMQLGIDAATTAEMSRVRKALDAAERERDEARASNRDLHRRAQQAEAALRRGIEAHGPGSLGRAAANTAARMYQRAAEEAETEAARLREALAHAERVAWALSHGWSVYAEESAADGSPVWYWSPPGWPTEVPVYPSRPESYAPRADDQPHAPAAVAAAIDADRARRQGRAGTQEGKADGR